MYLKARGGAITETNISLSSGDDAIAEQSRFDDALRGKNIHEIRDFQETFVDIGNANGRGGVQKVMRWLNEMFAKP